MEANTSYRLSGNGYDTATEDSISMYYSFNGTEEDKTLANSDLESSIEVAIEGDTLNTVVKVPQTTPIKGKFPKCLQLNGISSSTPSDKKNLYVKLMKSTQIAEHKKEEDVKTISSQQSQQEIQINEIQENDVSTKQLEPPKIIEECLNEIHVVNISSNDNSVEIIEESTGVDTAVVLKDTCTKIWPTDNKMDNAISTKTELESNSEKPEMYDTMIKAKSLDAQHSLADNMVEEIRTLLQGSKLLSKGKENMEDDVNEKASLETGDKLMKSAEKKTSGLKKPSRLSVNVARKSLLQYDATMGTKTITPMSRIIPNPRKSVSSLSSGIPTPREISTSSSYSSLKSGSDDTVATASSRRSLMPSSKRMSIFPEAKASLTSIPENNPQVAASKPSIPKRYSVVNLKPKTTDSGRSGYNLRVAAKTTLNSPVMARRDAMRKSISKFTVPSSYSFANQKIGSSARHQLSSKLEVKSETSLPKSASSTDKLKKHISHDDFVCEVCSRSFRVSSIFEAHKKTHNPSAKKETNTCKFCDKTFAIMKALDKHLLENCIKIPLSERKKVKIAASQIVEETSARGMTSGGSRSGYHQNGISTLPINSRKSVASNLMPPPASSSAKAVKMPHSGITKTPTKTVKCKPCEKSFDNVLSFAEHVLSHSNNSLADK